MNAVREFTDRGYAVEYFKVDRDAAKLNEMLGINGGSRQVPTIVEGGKFTIGFGGS